MIYDMYGCQCRILKEININTSIWKETNITVYYFKNAFCEKKFPLMKNLRIKSLNLF